MRKDSHFFNEVFGGTLGVESALLYIIINKQVKNSGGVVLALYCHKFKYICNSHAVKYHQSSDQDWSVLI